MSGMSFRCLLEGFGLGVLVVLLGIGAGALLVFAIWNLGKLCRKAVMATPLRRISINPNPVVFEMVMVTLAYVAISTGLVFAITVIGIGLLNRIGSACVVR